MSAARRMKFARDAVEAAVTLLETLPRSPQRERLLAEAATCRASVEGWARETPAPEEHEATMRAILKLHMSAARLGRGTR